MKAITIEQPWATLIALGEKQFETRSWTTRYLGELAIHAGKNIDKVACQEESIKSTLAKHGYTADSLPTGVIVATVQLAGSYRIYDTADNGVHIVRCPNDKYDFEKVEYIRKPESDFGYYSAWELTDVQRLPEPVAVKGQLSLWNWEGIKGI